jgi:hypothetical protein
LLLEHIDDGIRQYLVEPPKLAADREALLVRLTQLVGPWQAADMEDLDSIIPVPHERVSSCVGVVNRTEIDPSPVVTLGTWPSLGQAAIRRAHRTPQTCDRAPIQYVA